MLQLSRDQLLESYRRMKTIREFKPQLEKLFADPTLVSGDMINDVLKYKRLDGVDGVLRKTAESIFGGGKQRADLRAKLASIKVPIQVIFGAKDQIISAEHAKGLPSNVTVHIIPTAGHMSHMEAGEVNRLIAGVVTA
jgi:pyruvate dehydrogenase E2 component (dihydrolipoamide acetyltransferase)